MRNNDLAAQTSLEFFNKILFKGLVSILPAYFLTIKKREKCEKNNMKIRVAIFWKFRISRVSVYVSLTEVRMRSEIRFGI